MDECKPLYNGWRIVDRGIGYYTLTFPHTSPGRGLHTSTFRLNFSAFCGIEVR